MLNINTGFNIGFAFLGIDAFTFCYYHYPIKYEVRRKNQFNRWRNIPFYKKKLDLLANTLENTEIFVIFLEKEKYEDKVKQRTILDHMDMMYSFKFTGCKNFMK